MAGETVNFEMIIVNIFRSRHLEGTLEVIVVEDSDYAFEREAQRYTYWLTIAPGERKTVTGAFKTYSKEASSSRHPGTAS